MNSLAYIIYLSLTYLVTVHVGMVFFKNGRLYILELLNGDTALTDSINRLLLTGYYLLNLGYAAVMISTWQKVTTYGDLVASIVVMCGRIFLSLAVIHFFNMGVIYILGKRKKMINHN
ncbi:MAG: hypothetical protein H7Y31_06625 [Chitinophagaceae bacterium]|nr:hypothetical protein [Chitinophagaceae bacterium]